MQSYKKIQDMIKCILEYCPNIGNIYTRHIDNKVFMKVSYTRISKNNYEIFYYVFNIEEDASFDEAEHLGNILMKYDQSIKVS